MEQTLLQYFNEELAYLRKGIKGFAQRYPHVASRLHLEAGAMEDPHVTRLLESFALISSRIRGHQDENFEKLNNGLLEALFPHYLAPIPSMAIVQYQPADNLKKPIMIQRGEVLETLPIQGKPLNFTACYTSEILPVNIKRLAVREGCEDSCIRDGSIKSSLCLDLLSIDASIVFAKFNLKNLRFFINEKGAQGIELYQQIMQNCVAVTIKNPLTQQIIAHLPANAIKPVGFASDEATMPWPSASAPSWRILSEYLNFREKFLFFDLNLDEDRLVSVENHLEIQLHFKTLLPKQMNYLNKSSFALNCTPVINLFKRSIEPLVIDEQTYEYPIVVDKRNLEHYEVHTIESITDITNAKNPKQISGLYRQHHTADGSIQWNAQRKYNTLESHKISTIYLSFTEDRESLDSDKQRILDIEASCFNGNLPEQLYLPESVNHLQLTKGGASLKGIRFITEPTPVRRRIDEHKEHGQLISQLANNYMRLNDPVHALTHVRTVFSACDVAKTAENQTLLNSIMEIDSQQILVRTNDSKISPFVYGSKISVNLNQKVLSSRSLFLFSEVFKKTFAMSCDMNTTIEWEFNVKAYD